MPGPGFFEWGRCIGCRGTGQQFGCRCGPCAGDGVRIVGLATLHDCTVDFELGEPTKLVHLVGASAPIQVLE